MAIRRASWLVVVLAAAGCASAGGGGAPATHTPEEEQAAWMKAGTPGPQHQRFAQHAGNWTVEGSMWMAPDAPATAFKGKARLQVVMESRYEIQDFEGDFMGMPFHGMGVTAYNNATGKYEGSWWDSMSTMIMQMGGTEDAQGTITLESEFADPFGERIRMRHVMRDDGPDHIAMEAYCFATPAQGGAEYKCMELHYRRAK